MKNKSIKKVVELAKVYVSEGYTNTEAVRKAEQEVKKKEDMKYGICS